MAPRRLGVQKVEPVVAARKGSPTAAQFCDQVRWRNHQQHGEAAPGTARRRTRRRIGWELRRHVCQSMAGSGSHAPAEIMTARPRSCCASIHQPENSAPMQNRPMLLIAGVRLTAERNGIWRLDSGSSPRNASDFIINHSPCRQVIGRPFLWACQPDRCIAQIQCMISLHFMPVPESSPVMLGRSAGNRRRRMVVRRIAAYLKHPRGRDRQRRRRQSARPVALSPGMAVDIFAAKSMPHRLRPTRPTAKLIRPAHKLPTAMNARDEDHR